MTTPFDSATAWGPIADAAAQDAGGVDPELLADFLPALVGAVATGNRLGRRDLASYRDAGRRAAARGVALRALLDLYLSAMWRLWPHLPAVASGAGIRQAVVRAGEVMLRAADDVVAVLTEGYQLARRDLVAAQAAARREFVDDLLLGGTQGLAGLVERAGSFGLSLAGPHAVVVVQAERPFTDSSPLTAMLERSILGAKADADALVTTKEGSLVVIFAAPDRGAIDGVIDGLTGSLPAGSHRRPACGCAAPPRSGPGGWASAGPSRGRPASGCRSSRRSRHWNWAPGSAATSRSGTRPTCWCSGCWSATRPPCASWWTRC